ncbi:MAG: hypothetical protein HY815_31525 [Candidatus Riflebacteria bacterium]|nr:hypothetical protein [Candidatus Riflebacteria bacterium]
MRRLIHPAVVSSVSILSREESRTLCGLRTLVEGWIGGLEASDGGLVVRTEKRMTSSGSVARKRLEGTVSSLKGGKPWAALFADNSQLQSVLAAFSPPGWDHPALGFGIQTTLAGTSIDLAYIGRSLSEMQGATTDRLAEGETVHVYRWALDHPSVLSLLPGKGPGDPDWNDALATDPGFLQGWIGRSAWIPLMDRADGYELTPYESCSSLDWFRGVLPGDGGLHDAKMTRAGCSRVLRFVSPRLWLGPPLVALVDRAKMEHVAELTELGHGWRVVARAEGDLVALEEALLPVLPVESARVKRSS